jgi:hypothetical protein
LVDEFVDEDRGVFDQVFILAGKAAPVFGGGAHVRDEQGRFGLCPRHIHALSLSYKKRRAAKARRLVPRHRVPGAMY